MILLPPLLKLFRYATLFRCKKSTKRSGPLNWDNILVVLHFFATRPKCTEYSLNLVILIILFPSSLMHEVGNVEKTHGKRVSLAFNVFVKGSLGRASDLTALKI